MRTRFEMPILKYPSGKSGYNKKIKQLLMDAGNRYTMLEIKDRFELMNAAFGQEDYIVDKNLNVTQSDFL